LKGLTLVAVAVNSSPANSKESLLNSIDRHSRLQFVCHHTIYDVTKKNRTTENISVSQEVTYHLTQLAGSY
jgi:hypothetical protein